MSELKTSRSQRHSRPGLTITTIERETYQEFHLTLQPLPGEKPAEMVHRLSLALRIRNAAVVRHEVFGSNTVRGEVVSALKHEFGRLDWPIMWVEGLAVPGQSIAGMHIFAVAGTQVDTLDLDGRPIARIYNDGRARHCLLGEVMPSNRTFSKADQCRQTFDQMEQILARADMKMTNVVRTWFFLEDILSWYELFNQIRNEFYRAQNVFGGLMPASTGIGGTNPWGMKMIAGVWATERISTEVTVDEVLSPMQQSSLDYGSAFSRAVQITTPAGQRLFVSGTASIDKTGQSVHRGNIQKQIALTMDVVREILISKGLNFSDVTRATAYFKDIKDISVLQTWQREQGVDLFPVVAAQGEICRDELLFEIELDAVR